jgi:Serine carboxypeptidase S28
MLVTWFRKKYPHLVDGAWSSSAPINAKMDFKEYLEVTQDAIEKFGSVQCASRIEKSFEQLDSLIKQGNASKITEIFNLCSPIDLSKQGDLWLLVDDLMGPWMYVVQSGSRHNRLIEDGCESFLAEEANSDIEAHAKWFKNINGMGTQCYDPTWETFLTVLNNVNWFPGFIWRQWFHQTCAEIGLFVTGNSGTTIFGSLTSLDFPLRRCLDLYNGM